MSNPGHWVLTGRQHRGGVVAGSFFDQKKIDSRPHMQLRFCTCRCRIVTDAGPSAQRLCNARMRGIGRAGPNRSDGNQIPMDHARAKHEDVDGWPDPRTLLSTSKRENDARPAGSLQSRAHLNLNCTPFRDLLTRQGITETAKTAKTASSLSLNGLPSQFYAYWRESILSRADRLAYWHSAPSF
jgi:hypothetical protein